MKLKTSFFDSAVLKKDITRYFPVWAIYFIGGLLVSQTMVNNFGNDFSSARNLVGSLSAMCLINCGYAAVIALLLYGDLFKSKMCNALHALPVRREGWFVSHTTAALLMSLAPNLVLSVLMMPALGQFWYTALLWMLLMTMEFVFFYGLAVFSMQCVGNHFAAALVYGIFNFGALLVMWVVEVFVIPMLYGVRLQEEPFFRFSPLWHMLSEEPDFWSVTHLDSCPCRTAGAGYFGGNYQHHARFEGLGSGWGYLTVLAVLGVVFLAAALLLYRRRKLESAGDFAAVKPMGWVFTLVGSVLMGMVFRLFTIEAVMGYILLVAGMLVGFFGCRMLLERKVKVFSKGNWLRLTALVVSFALFLTLAAVDVLGISRRVPDVEDVRSVTVSESILSEYQLEKIEDLEEMTRGVDPYYQYGRDGMLTLRQSAQIAEIMRIHELLIEEGDASKENRNYTPITIHYTLKNGTTLTRYYYGASNGEAVTRLRNFTNTPEYILGVDSPQKLLQDLDYVYCTEFGEIHKGEWIQKLAQALYADAAAGDLVQPDYGIGRLYVEWNYTTADGYYRFLNVYIPASAQNTQKWMEEYAAYLKQTEQTDS